MQAGSDTDQDAPHSTAGGAQPLWLWLSWVLAMALTGVLLGMLSQAALCGTGWLGSLLTWPTVLLGGVGLGLIQWLVLRPMLPGAQSWVVRTGAGWLLGGLLGLFTTVAAYFLVGMRAPVPAADPLGTLRDLMPGMLVFGLLLGLLQAGGLPKHPAARWWVPANVGGSLLALGGLVIAQRLLTLAGMGWCGARIGALADPLGQVFRLGIGGLAGGAIALPVGALTGAALPGLLRLPSQASARPASRWLPRLATLGLVVASLPLWVRAPRSPALATNPAQLRTVPCWYTGPTNDYGLGKVYSKPAIGGPDEGYYQPPQLRCSDRTADSPEGRWRWAEGDFQSGWVLEANLQQAGPGRTASAQQPGQYELAGIEASGTVIAAGWLPGGHELFVATAEAGLRLWDSQKPQPPRELAGAAGDLQAAAGLPDGQALLVADRSETPRLIDAASGQERARLKHSVVLGERITGVYVGPDGRMALAAWTDGNIRGWDLASGAETLDLWGHERVTGLVTTPDGRTIVSAQFDRGLQLWDVASGKDTRLIGPPRYRVTSLAISPDGASLLAGSTDGIVRRWELASGQQLGDLIKPFDAPVTSLASSPDGKTALAGSADGTIVLLELASGRELRRLLGHTNLVSSLAFHPDGKTALSGSWDGTLRVWRVE